MTNESTRPSPGVTFCTNKTSPRRGCVSSPSQEGAVLVFILEVLDRKSESEAESA